jgi:hypothetical protein
MVSRKSASKRKKSGLGCGFTAAVGLTTITLLIVNRLILDSIFGSVGEEEARIIDPLKFVLAVVMIFFEYWIYDFITSRWVARFSK